MADEEFEISLSATGADEAAREVEKVEESTQAAAEEIQDLRKASDEAARAFDEAVEAAQASVGATEDQARAEADRAAQGRDDIEETVEVKVAAAEKISAAESEQRDATAAASAESADSQVADEERVTEAKSKTQAEVERLVAVLQANAELIQRIGEEAVDAAEEEAAAQSEFEAIARERLETMTEEREGLVELAEERRNAREANDARAEEESIARQRRFSAGVLRTSVALRAAGAGLQQVSQDIAQVAPGASAQLETLSKGLNTVSESVGLVSAGFRTAGPWGAVAGAVAATANIVVQELRRIGIETEQQIEIQRNLEQASLDYTRTLQSRFRAEDNRRAITALDNELRKIEQLNEALDFALERSDARRAGESRLQVAQDRVVRTQIESDSNLTEPQREQLLFEQEQLIAQRRSAAAQERINEEIQAAQQRQVEATDAEVVVQQQLTQAKQELEKATRDEAEASRIRRTLVERFISIETRRAQGGSRAREAESDFEDLRSTLNRRSGPLADARSSRDVIEIDNENQARVDELRTRVGSLSSQVQSLAQTNLESLQSVELLTAELENEIAGTTAEIRAAAVEQQADLLNTLQTDLNDLGRDAAQELEQVLQVPAENLSNSIRSARDGIQNVLDGGVVATDEIPLLTSSVQQLVSQLGRGVQVTNEGLTQVIQISSSQQTQLETLVGQIQTLGRRAAAIESQIKSGR